MMLYPIHVYMKYFLHFVSKKLYKPNHKVRDA